MPAPEIRIILFQIIFIQIICQRFFKILYFFSRFNKQPFYSNEYLPSHSDGFSFLIQKNKNNLDNLNKHNENLNYIFGKELKKQKEDLIVYSTLKKCLNSQNEMINNLIEKMNQNKENKKKRELEYMKHKIHSLESKIFMKTIERNQLDFLSSLKKGKLISKHYFYNLLEMKEKSDGSYEYANNMTMNPFLFNSLMYYFIFFKKILMSFIKESCQ